MLKNAFLIVVLFLGLAVSSKTQSQAKYKVITVVESIVSGGLGRSRIIDSQTEMNAKDYTTERTDGKKSGQGNVERSEIKIDKFEETKLVNFFSMVGINFQNIASNDALISSKINDMIAAGWELKFVTSGVESDGGKGDENGLFITRFIFMKK